MFQSLEECVEKLEELLEEGEPIDEVLEEALKRFDAPVLHLYKAEALLDEEDLEAARNQARALIEEHTLAPEEKSRALSVIGWSYYYEDTLEKARQAFNDAVAADGENLFALQGRASTHENLSYFRAALLDLDRIIALDDSLALPFAMRGAIHLIDQDIENARRDLGHAIDINEEDEESRLNLARIYAMEGQNDRAIELLEPLVEDGVEPEFVAPGALLRAQLTLALGSVEAALSDCEIARQHAEDEPWAFLQMAACHIHAQIDGGHAIECLKEAEKRIDNLRKIPDIFALRSAAYELLGKSDKAAEEREKMEGFARLPEYVYGPLNPAQSVPINPDNPFDVRALLTQIFGDPDKAPQGYEEELRKLVKEIPDAIAANPGVQEINIELPPIPGASGKPQLVFKVNAPSGKGAQ